MSHPLLSSSSPGSTSCCISQGQPELHCAAMLPEVIWIQKAAKLPKCLWNSQFCCMQLCIAKACLELLGLLLQMTSGSSPLPKTSGRRSQSTEQDVHQKAWQLRWKCQMWSDVKWCEAMWSDVKRCEVIRTVKHCKKAGLHQFFSFLQQCLYIIYYNIYYIYMYT